MRIAILSTCLLPAVIQAAPEAGVVQLPVALQQWTQIETSPSTEALKAFKRGMENYFNERYPASLDALADDQAGKATAIGDYVLFYRAKSKLMLERNQDALRDFQSLESRYPDSPLVREALIQQCEILLTLKEAKAALEVLGDTKIGTSSETLYYQARALDMLGDREKAAELYLRIYSRYPSSKYSPAAVQYFVAESPGAFKGVRNYEARLQRAESLIDSGDSRGARVLLVALGRVSAPNTKASEKRNLLFGEVEYRLGKTSTAIPYFRKVTAADPTLHANALYLEGICYRKLDRVESLLSVRDRLLKLYPRSSEAQELCYSAATYFDVNYRPARSREAYSVLYEAFPKGRYAERALWKMALFPYFEKRYGDAALGFWKYLLAYPSPIPAGSAMYWMGRCYEKLGDTGSAKYLYSRARSLGNESFYGQRAREAEMALQKEAGAAGRAALAGIDFDQVIATCDGIELPPIELAEPGSAGTRVIERARLLIAAGLSDLALTELRWGRTQHPEDEDALLYVMSRIYVNKQDYDAAIACLRRAFPDYSNRPVSSLPEEIWDVLFPVRHWGTISEQAAKLNIDPTLVLGLIRQESAFQVDARSKANARGLMQILPSTGRKLARQARITRFNSKKLYQAETNIILGTRFLASLLQQYGKAELALAAYNAGGSRVDLWLKEWGNLDSAEFVEQIPFSETRGYVKQVLSNSIRYGVLTSAASAR